MESEAQNDPLFPIAVLIDELKVTRVSGSSVSGSLANNVTLPSMMMFSYA